MKTGEEFLKEFNDQDFGKVDGYYTLSEMVDMAIQQAREEAFDEAEKMGEVNLFARNRGWQVNK